MEVCSRVFGLHSPLFENSQRPHIALAVDANNAKGKWHSIQVDKCSFLAEIIDYLEHFIRPDESEIAHTTALAIKELKYLMKQSELWSFLGSCTMFSASCKISAVLPHRPTRGTARISGCNSTLTAPEKHAVEQLNFLLTNLRVLALAYTDGRLPIDTDACKTQLVCILLEKQQDGTIRAVEYSSKALGVHEKNLATTEKECLAVV